MGGAAYAPACIWLSLVLLLVASGCGGSTPELGGPTGASVVYSTCGEWGDLQESERQSGMPLLLAYALRQEDALEKFNHSPEPEEALRDLLLDTSVPEAVDSVAGLDAAEWSQELAAACAEGPANSLTILALMDLPRWMLRGVTPENAEGGDYATLMSTSPEDVPCRKWQHLSQERKAETSAALIELALQFDGSSAAVMPSHVHRMVKGTDERCNLVGADLANASGAAGYVYFEEIKPLLAGGR